MLPKQASIRQTYTMRFEVFENERYSPISKWSSQSLLINDRGSLSTEDGNVDVIYVWLYVLIRALMHL